MQRKARKEWQETQDTLVAALQRAIRELGQLRGRKLNFDLELAIATGNSAIAKAKETN